MEHGKYYKLLSKGCKEWEIMFVWWKLIQECWRANMSEDYIDTLINSFQAFIEQYLPKEALTGTTEKRQDYFAYYLWKAGMEFLEHKSRMS